MSATTQKKDLTAALLSLRVRRIERALAELADELHGLSSPGQLAGKGRHALASLVDDYRRGLLDVND